VSRSCCRPGTAVKLLGPAVIREKKMAIWALFRLF
jgi:hypothetical protein